MLTLLTKFTRLFKIFYLSLDKHFGIALSLIFLHFLIMLNNSATEALLFKLLQGRHMLVTCCLNLLHEAL